MYIMPILLQFSSCDCHLSFCFFYRSVTGTPGEVVVMDGESIVVTGERVLWWLVTCVGSSLVDEGVLWCLVMCRAMVVHGVLDMLRKCNGG